MDSLKELFKIGCGPSSSHTMGPERAAKKFKAETEGANLYIVELYGSLAATGKGHLTDWIIEETLKPTKTEIVWMPEYIHEYHTNGMKFIALDKDGKVIETVKNDAKGNIKFSALEFKRGEEGTYTYTVEEVKGTETGVEYDKMVATVTVTVTKEGKVLTATSQFTGRY